MTGLLPSVCNSDTDFWGIFFFFSRLRKCYLNCFISDPNNMFVVGPRWSCMNNNTGNKEASRTEARPDVTSGLWLCEK